MKIRTNTALKSALRTSQKNLFSVFGFALLAIAAGNSTSQAKSPEATSSSNLASMPAVKLYLDGVQFRLSRMSESEAWDAFSYTTLKGERKSLLDASSLNAPSLPTWALKDLTRDGVPGTSTERAYEELHLQAPAVPVTVAVIDSGVDIQHEDLAGQIYTNEKELNGVAGVDDDGNGFIDDIHGWNFLGNANGQDLIHCNLEMTRELSRMKRKELSGQPLTEEDQVYLARLQAAYDEARGESVASVQTFKTRLNELQTALDVLKQNGLKEETLAAVQKFQSLNETVLQAREVALYYLGRGMTTATIKTRISTSETTQKIYFDLAFDPSSIIGDSERLDEVGYGNNHVTTETADHGTHVSGIIAAVRDNSIGINGQAGQAKFVKILPVRAVPDGDERDKDVANAVLYAVRQGAKIINMSFGKGFSPFKPYVDSAFKFAEEQGVLVVQAAGNDSSDNDRVDHYPNRRMRTVTGFSEFQNYMVVGASTQTADEKLPASFSNYGATSVDLFAPGSKILSSIPGNRYAAFSGTSMASPEVAGVAALVLSQYPNLSAVELRQILMESARSFKGLVVGTRAGKPIDFATLSKTGGVVNAYEALRLASLKSGRPSLR
ncbi:MAG: S8 family serine peptidase [Methylotenera sp.]|nr:S8 family serine peptidase [Oligoflexia bacterium]